MNRYIANRDRWLAWHNTNPHVWAHFERFALEAVRRGRVRISHWLIVNRIRWEVQIVTLGCEFKVSNDFIGFYARLWIERHPEHRGLFAIKPMLDEPWPFVTLFPDLV